MMSFQSALIVYAAYFLTSAWSIKINSDQLIQLNGVFKNYKKSINEVSEVKIAHVVKHTFGMELTNLKTTFKYRSNDFDSINFYHLLVALANNHSEICRVKNYALLNVDVVVFLDEFNEHVESEKQQGYLTLPQLLRVYKHWKTMNNALIVKIKKLETEENVDYVMNAGEFVLIMMEIKPKGYGLTLEQSEMFGSLYEAHKTLLGSIDPKESEQAFNELGITIDDKLERLLNSGRDAELLLIDLIVAAAERNMAIEENEWRVLSPTEVDYFINQFTILDADNDSLVSIDEYAVYMKHLSSIVSEECPEALGEAELYLKKFYGEVYCNSAKKVLINDGCLSSSDKKNEFFFFRS